MASTAQKTIPTLHNLASSQGFRCLWALEEIKAKNPSFEYKVINYPRNMSSLKALAQIHPLGKSPILTLETTDGSPPPTPQVTPGVLTESKLILDYINSEYGNGLFTPSTEEDRNRDKFFTELAVETLGLKINYILLFQMPPKMAPFPINYVFSTALWPLRHHVYGDLDGIWQLMEDSLSAEKPYFGGRAIGLSDLNMTWGMDTSSMRGYFSPAKYPKLQAWLESVRKEVGYQEALKKTGKYDLSDKGLPTWRDAMK